MRPTFDTAKFQTTLTDAGVPESQARAQTKALTEVLDDVSVEFIRSDRFERSEQRMIGEFEKLRLELEKLRLEFKSELSENLRVQGFAIIGAVAALIAAATALVKFTP